LLTRNLLSQQQHRHRQQDQKDSTNVNEARQLGNARREKHERIAQEIAISLFQQQFKQVFNNYAHNH
jgi:hypothetical protein